MEGVIWCDSPRNGWAPTVPRMVFTSVAGSRRVGEAAALGTPVYTTYGGRLGGVDEALIRSGRLRPLTDPRAVEVEKRSAAATPVRRDPALLVGTILGTVGAAPSRDEPHPVTPS